VKPLRGRASAVAGGVALHASPMPVLRWSATKSRKAEAVRDCVMRGAGTDDRAFPTIPSKGTIT